MISLSSWVFNYKKISFALLLFDYLVIGQSYVADSSIFPCLIFQHPLAIRLYVRLIIYQPQKGGKDEQRTVGGGGGGGGARVPVIVFLLVSQVSNTRR